MKMRNQSSKKTERNDDQDIEGLPILTLPSLGGYYSFEMEAVKKFEWISIMFVIPRQARTFGIIEILINTMLESIGEKRFGFYYLLNCDVQISE